MKFIFAVLLSLLVLPAAPTSAADCKSVFSAVLTAMRSGGPMRRSDVVTKDGAVIERMVMDVSPPDQMKRVTELDTKAVFKMFVSGEKAWTVSKNVGKPEEPPKLIDGAGVAKIILKDALGLEETNAPLIDCPSDGGTLTLTWKGEDGRKSVHNVARVDAKTHVVKILTRSTLDKLDNSKYERKSTYTAIPAFTVDEPSP